MRELFPVFHIAVFLEYISKIIQRNAQQISAASTDVDRSMLVYYNAERITCLYLFINEPHYGLCKLTGVATVRLTD